jgi:hypothetical protein
MVELCFCVKESFICLSPVCPARWGRWRRAAGCGPGSRPDCSQGLRGSRTDCAAGKIRRDAFWAIFEVGYICAKSFGNFPVGYICAKIFWQFLTLGIFVPNFWRFSMLGIFVPKIVGDF